MNEKLMIFSFKDITKFEIYRRVVMQPKHSFKKTLLAGGLILGLGNAFTASAEEFTIKASAIPDVAAAPVATFTTLSFGQRIKGQQINETCTIRGKSEALDLHLNTDSDQSGTDVDASGEEFGSVHGNACIDDTTGTATGSAMIIEIDGSASNTVSISVPTIVGTGYTYRASAETCVVTYLGTAADDLCVSLDSDGNATGIQMAAAFGTEKTSGPATATDYNEEGTTRLILAGELTIDAPGIAQGTPTTQAVAVIITYD